MNNGKTAATTIGRFQRDCQRSRRAWGCSEVGGAGAAMLVRFAVGGAFPAVTKLG